MEALAKAPKQALKPQQSDRHNRRALASNCTNTQLTNVPSDITRFTAALNDEAD